MLRTLVLMILVDLVSSNKCGAVIKQTQMCDVPYGYVIGVIDDVRSVIECSVRCEADKACMSFTYTRTNQTCTINAELQFEPNPCGNDVIYGAAVKRECTFDSQHVMSGGDPTVPPPTATTQAPPTTNTQGAASTTATSGGWQTSICTSGDRYDPTLNMCVPDCSVGFGPTFTYQSDWTMWVGNTVYEQLTGLSDPELCRQHCLAETAFVCRTFQISMDRHECFWMDGTPFTVPLNDYYAKPNYFLWHRDCL